MLLNENGYTEASTQSIIQMSKQLNFVMLGNVIMREIITKPVDNKKNIEISIGCNSTCLLNTLLKGM